MAESIVPQAPAGSRYIPLTRGYFTLVDEADYPRLAVFKWHVAIKEDRIYARRRGRPALNEPINVLMHRFILGLKPGDPDVDHEHGEGLDNRRLNLRKASVAQNLRNRGVTKTKVCRYKGVFLRTDYNTKRSRWRAIIVNASRSSCASRNVWNGARGCCCL